MEAVAYREDKVLPRDQVLALYAALRWSSADKPVRLLAALEHSHTVVTAWAGERLVGLGNALSDGFLVVYYPHLLVHPDYRGQGIGTKIVRRMQARYIGLHQQAVVADGRAVDFYKRLGFTQAGSCQALWIYDGHDHD